MNCAIIDVGSNSIRLMVLVDGKPIFTEIETTRLGKYLAVNNSLGGEEFEKSIQAISMFCKRARLAHAFNIKIFATEAVRSATNGKQFAFSVFATTGEKLQILTGEEEAAIAYAGATTSNEPSLVIDIGGGSTEIAIGDNGRVTYSKSYAIGAVRSFAKSGDNKIKVDADLDSVFSDITSIIGEKQCFCVGGTCTSVAMLLIGGEKYNSVLTHGYVINRSDLEELSDRLFDIGIEGRDKLLAIKPQRREIIANGTRILLNIMVKLQIDSITASEDDNLIGYYRVFMK